MSRAPLTRMKPGQKLPWVIAHRGHSAGYPENTLPAFKAALAAGCDGIETDVQLTADGEPVLFHDWVLNKAGRRGRRVESMELAELRKLDAGSWFDRRHRRVRIATLDEVLRRHGKACLWMLEVKSHPKRRVDGRYTRLGALVARRLKAAGLLRHAVLLSFDPEVLEAGREAVPQVRTVLNVKRMRRVGARERKQLEPLDGVSFDIRTVTPALVRDVQELGKPVYTWTCNSRRRVQKALDAKVDAIMSDAPSWLASELP